MGGGLVISVMALASCIGSGALVASVELVALGWSMEEEIVGSVGEIGAIGYRALISI